MEKITKKWLESILGTINYVSWTYWCGPEGVHQLNMYVIDKDFEKRYRNLKGIFEVYALSDLNGEIPVMYGIDTDSFKLLDNVPPMIRLEVICKNKRRYLKNATTNN
jgi:hypothetical protein